MNWSLPKKQEFPSHFKGFQYTFGLFCFHGCPLCYLVHPASGGGGCLLEESSPEMLHPCFGGSAFLLGRAWHRRILQIWGEGDMKRSILHALTGKRSSRPAESIWNEKKKKKQPHEPNKCMGVHPASEQIRGCRCEHRHQTTQQSHESSQATRQCLPVVAKVNW